MGSPASQIGQLALRSLSRISMEDSMMSNRHVARLAGALFLIVIAAVLASSVLQGGVSGADDIADTFRTVADNTVSIRASTVLLMVAGVGTLALAAMLYALTKRQDENLAILALACRVVEAALYAVKILSVLILLSLSQAPTAGEQELGAVVADVASWSTNVGAAFFAVGSTLFAYLLLRARSIPVPLAALGVGASLILVVGVPLETAASRTTAEGASIIMWLPMFVFEIATGVWLLVRGARTPIPDTSLVAPAGDVRTRSELAVRLPASQAAQPGA
ncbi:DUF4386 domain-containing protein [Pseudofrankia sp. BMG5.37]|nr:DUF4386 domain-containing protein [Pseudofrankia sp. BMG5.37]MDT3444428.1 DUF4386 domain-containing protein [Pseudofrankia sp. BMG5.37]